MNLAKFHTKQLLEMLYKTRYWNSGCFMYGCFGCWRSDPPLPYAANQLREELAKRPHVPNKKESKELRKLRKKQG